MHTSYVIPAYNASGTLAEAVDSIFNGNFFEGDEVIIVNDASTDETSVVASKLAIRYSPHIKIIESPQNNGCPASRNIGIREATCDLIFNLDSDNVLAPGGVRALHDAIVAEGADVAAFGEYRYFKESTNVVTHRWLCKSGIFTLADLFAGFVNQGPGGNFLYRKAIWERIGGYWEYGKGLHEAWGYSLKLLLAGATFIVVPNTFYYHRYSHQSLFMRESKKENEEISVTGKFISFALPYLDEESRTYVENNPEWYRSLDSHPLRMIDGSRGTDGKIVWSSPFKQALQLLRRRLA